ncbi:response regulator [Flavobacterium pallidum]|uniref:Response regulator n=1 Tax=Flavobacterium pallidum TaxID=2172098 RepID=A0A2S1SJZ8_9FLAO|nr:response regulator [Flavobacterium pallidum]AWI26744.1 response regulator [Flavobacterium pallidum]
MKSTPDVPCKSVMVVDDSDIDRYIAKKILAQHDPFCPEVMSYENPLEALSYLGLNQENIEALPKFIFLDIYMPEMSGFEFMEAYSHFSGTLKNHCSVYIVSSTIDPHDLVRAKKDANVVELHVKPINSQFLSKLAG